MKCSKCGREIDDPSIRFCPDCGTKLEWVQESREADNQSTEKEKAQVQPEPEASDQPDKTDKQPVTSKPKIHFGKDIGKAFQYAGSVLIHPVKAETPKRISVSLILDAIFFVNNFIVLFLTLHGLFQLKFNHAIGKIFTLHYQNDGMILNFGRMLEMSLLFTIIVLAGMIVLTLLSQLFNREHISFPEAVKQATRQMILPALVLLIAGILMMFKVLWGIVLAGVCLLVWTMNLNDLFRNQWRILSRSIVIVSTIGIIWLVIRVISAFFF